MSLLKRTYFDSGELDSEVIEINGKKEGEYKKYYSNGNLCIVCNYINDTQNGQYKEYHSNGQLYKIVYSNRSKR